VIVRGEALCPQCHEALAGKYLGDSGYPITVIRGVLRHKNANTTGKYLQELRGMKAALVDVSVGSTQKHGKGARKKKIARKVLANPPGDL